MSTSNRSGVVAGYAHADARSGALVELSCESTEEEIRELLDAAGKTLKEQLLVVRFVRFATGEPS